MPADSEPARKVGRRKKKQESGKSGVDASGSVKASHPRVPLEGPGGYAHFRRNLALLVEAREKRQFELGPSDVVAGDFDSSGIPAPEVIRTDWGDGSGGADAVVAAHRDETSEALSDFGSLLLGGGGRGGDEGSDGARGGGEAVRRRELSKRERQYVEGATGRFKKWREPSGRRGALKGSLGGWPAAESIEASSKGAYEKYGRAVKAMGPREQATWLLAQGLLAGLAAAPILLQFSSSSDAAFIEAYRRVASAMRRSLFVLAMAAAAGSVDALMLALKPPTFVVPATATATPNHRPFLPPGLEPLMPDASPTASPPGGGGSGSVRGLSGRAARQWGERGLEERALLVLVALLYLGVLVATVVCSVGDIVIKHRNGWVEALRHGGIDDGSVGAESWVAFSLGPDEASFRPKLRSWYTADTLRFCFGAAAWVLVARQRYLAQVADTAEEEMGALEDRLAALEERNAALSGRALEGKSGPALRRLLLDQRRALDATEAKLRNAEARAEVARAAHHHQQRQPQHWWQQQRGGARGDPDLV